MENATKSVDNAVEKSERGIYEDMDLRQKERLERLSYLSLAYAIQGDERGSERILSILRDKYGHPREIK